MGALREFFMWAILHEYKKAVEYGADDTDFFHRVCEILERLNDEQIDDTTRKTTSQC